MATEVKQILEGLDLTNDEVKRLKNAFEKPEFKKMFVEYAQEISDPKNKQRYEEEIAQMEMERGMDIQFIHPQPGCCLKTVVDGQIKAFINIAQNEIIGKPKVERQTCNGKAGVTWSIPHSFAPPRDELDKLKKPCKVYDVVFHPDTFHMATKNAQFRKLVEDTALDGLEKNYGVTVDRRNIRRPKLKYKGSPVATVIRKKREDFEGKQQELQERDKETPLPFPYPYDDQEKEKATAEEKEHEVKASNDDKTEAAASPYTKPSYTIKYSQNFDIQQFRSAPDAGPTTRPDQLVIVIDLPLIRSAHCLDLDITERQLRLKTEKPAAYLLDLNLAYPVDSERGSASFDKSTRKLTLTLPVTPPASEVKVGEAATAAASDTAEGVDSSTPLIEILQSQSFECGQGDQSVAAADTPIDAGTNALSRSAVQPLEGELVRPSDCRQPSVLFRQDPTTLTVLLQVPHVSPASVKLYAAPSPTLDLPPRLLTVLCTSVGAGGWPIAFSLSIACLAATTTVAYDVSEENLALVVPKGDSQWWKQVRYGVAPDRLTEVWRFESGPDESAIRSLAHNGSSNSQEEEAAGGSCLLHPHVTRMIQDLLEVVILHPGAPVPTIAEEEDCGDQRLLDAANVDDKAIDYDERNEEAGVNPCSSESAPHLDANQNQLPQQGGAGDMPTAVTSAAESKSIGEPRPLMSMSRPVKGILKQRSFSDSSSDETISIALNDPGMSRHWASGSLSPTDFPSADEGGNSPPTAGAQGIKKSVSFSRRDEKAFFAPGDTVNALRQSLRNRRRKARRRETRRLSESVDSSSPLDQTEMWGPCWDKEPDSAVHSAAAFPCPPRRMRRLLSDSELLEHRDVDVNGLPREHSNNRIPAAPARPAKKGKKGKPKQRFDNNPAVPNHCEPPANEQDANSDNPAVPNRCEPPANQQQTSSAQIPNKGTQSSKPRSSDPPSLLSWEELPGVTSRAAELANAHRTSCAVSLSGDVMFDLDDD